MKQKKTKKARPLKAGKLRPHTSPLKELAEFRCDEDETVVRVEIREI
jgi:hypothetical protein